MMSTDNRSDWKHLSNDIEKVFEEIREQSKKRQTIREEILTTLNQWKTEQISKIEEIYSDHSKLIFNENQLLKVSENKLIEQLKEQALKPLEYLQKQQIKDEVKIQRIQKKINQIREENKNFNWKISTFLPVNNMTKNKPEKVSRQDDGRPLKRLVTKFGKISSIETAKKDLLDHIEKLGQIFRVPILVCSYLTAWHKKLNIDEKVFLLTEYITIIQRYISKCKTRFDILLGIQIFFHNETIQENPNEMMSFLLQFFINHRCLNTNQILEWYYGKDTYRYKGFPQAKSLAAEFIQSISQAEKSTNSTNSVCEKQIKQESNTMI